VRWRAVSCITENEWYVFAGISEVSMAFARCEHEHGFKAMIYGIWHIILHY
jgi:hypothetical protein